MKRLLIALLTAVALPAMAGNWTVQRIGPFDYYNNDDGTSYFGQRIGPFYYLNSENGRPNYFGQRIGQFEYWTQY
jgi:hypothetical protein